MLVYNVVPTYLVQVRGSMVLSMCMHIIQRRGRGDLGENGEDELIRDLHQVLDVHHQGCCHVWSKALDTCIDI